VRFDAPSVARDSHAAPTRISEIEHDLVRVLRNPQRDVHDFTRRVVQRPTLKRVSRVGDRRGLWRFLIGGVHEVPEPRPKRFCAKRVNHRRAVLLRHANERLVLAIT